MSSRRSSKTTGPPAGKHGQRTRDEADGSNDDDDGDAVEQGSSATRAVSAAPRLLPESGVSLARSC